MRSGLVRGESNGNGSTRLVTLLDDIQRRLTDAAISDDDFRGAMDDLIHVLRGNRLESDPQQWPRVISQCREHPIREVLHEDPFTYRAYSKPRGYAGDAVLLDYIYGREELWPAPAASRLGQRIFDYTTGAPSTRGVRARRGFIAALIDRLAETVRAPAILSIAAGHLREASLMGSLKQRKLGRLIALDSDPESLREVERSYGRYGVETVLANFRQLFAGRLALDPLDLVYSTGLFDYLGPVPARRLVRQMFQMLRARGHLVVANFLPGVRDVGYMEVFMDWQLVFRTRQEMIDITMEIPQADIADIRLFAEDNQNIIFVQVTKV